MLQLKRQMRVDLDRMRVDFPGGRTPAHKYTLVVYRPSLSPHVITTPHTHTLSLFVSLSLCLSLSLSLHIPLTRIQSTATPLRGFSWSSLDSTATWATCRYQSQLTRTRAYIPISKSICIALATSLGHARCGCRDFFLCFCTTHTRTKALLRSRTYLGFRSIFGV